MLRKPHNFAHDAQSMPGSHPGTDYHGLIYAPQGVAFAQRVRLPRTTCGDFLHAVYGVASGNQGFVSNGTFRLSTVYRLDAPAAGCHRLQSSVRVGPSARRVPTLASGRNLPAGRARLSSEGYDGSIPSPRMATTRSPSCGVGEGPEAGSARRAHMTAPRSEAGFESCPRETFVAPRVRQDHDCRISARTGRRNGSVLSRSRVQLLPAHKAVAQRAGSTERRSDGRGRRLVGERDGNARPTLQRDHPGS